MRKTILAPGEYYHIYNKTAGESLLFREERDYIRFILLILFLQSPLTIHNTKRCVDHFIKYGKFDIDTDVINEIVEKRLVELVAFALMPTHFHLFLKEVKEKGISYYLHRIEVGLAKYSQIKYGASGHFYRGNFGATHVKDNTHLLYLSTYIHRNPRDLPKWKNREHEYPWSSYRDYIGENRWGKLLSPEIITEQFESKRKYKKFVETSIAKERKILTPELLFPSL